MNKVNLLGRLTKDPELKYTNNNTAVCSFTLAVNRRKQGEVDFINCQAWTKTAEFIDKYINKGQQIAISGRIQTRNWDDNDGKKHYITEIVVEEVFFADSKKETKQEVVHSDVFDENNDDELPF